MSTRCNVRIKDNYETLWFYRHSDGYPSVTVPSLWKILTWLHEARIRNNPEQAAGWLILIGADEYRDCGKFEKNGNRLPKENVLEPGSPDEISGWKCGAYEPCTGVHGDIEYLYEIDLDAQKLRCFKVSGFGEGNQEFKAISTYSKESPPPAEIPE